LKTIGIFIALPQTVASLSLDFIDGLKLVFVGIEVVCFGSNYALAALVLFWYLVHHQGCLVIPILEISPA